MIRNNNNNNPIANTPTYFVNELETHSMETGKRQSYFYNFFILSSLKQQHSNIFISYFVIANATFVIALVIHQLEATRIWCAHNEDIIISCQRLIM